MCDKCTPMDDMREPTYSIHVKSGIVTIDLGAIQVDMDALTAQRMGEELFRRGCEAAQVPELRGDHRSG